MSTTQPFDPKLTSLLWAGPERAADIAAIHGVLFDPPWDEASVARSLDAPGATSLVAAHGIPRVTAGFVIGQVAADEAEIISIGVAADFQRNGIGGKLIEALERAVKKAGAKTLHLEVAADNAAAMALYARAGFKEAGRRKGYYERAGAASVDALRLAKPV